MKKTMFLLVLAIAIFSSCKKGPDPQLTNNSNLYGTWLVDSVMINRSTVNLVADSQTWVIAQTSTTDGTITFSTTAETFTRVQDTLESLGKSYLVTVNTPSRLTVLKVVKQQFSNYYQIVPADTEYTYLHK